MISPFLSSLSLTRWAVVYCVSLLLLSILVPLSLSLSSFNISLTLLSHNSPVSKSVKGRERERVLLSSEKSEHRRGKVMLKEWCGKGVRRIKRWKSGGRYRLKLLIAPRWLATILRLLIPFLKLNFFLPLTPFLSISLFLCLIPEMFFLPKTTCERKSSVITELPDLLSPFTRHIFDLKRNRENEPGFGSQTWTRSERIKRWKKWPQLMTLIRSFSFYWHLLQHQYFVDLLLFCSLSHSSQQTHSLLLFLPFS